MSEKRASEAGAVSFGERLAGSQLFATLFRDGMALVEETASYLDGSGRTESKKLERNAAMVYATESMRLTTRLMQLASWLLLHRAVKEGEMTLAQAHKEKSKVRLAACDPGDAKSAAVLSKLEEDLRLKLPEGPVPVEVDAVYGRISAYRPEPFKRKMLELKQILK